MKCLICEYWLTFYFKKNRGYIKWGVGNPNKNGAKSSKDRYDNDIENKNRSKDE